MIFPLSGYHRSLYATQPGVQQHYSGEDITNVDLRTIANTTSYPQITKNERTFSAPSLPLSHQSVKIHQPKRKQRSPSNLAWTLKLMLQLGDALCSGAPITPQKSFMETHSSENEAKVASESVWLSWLLGTLAILTFRKHACSVSNNFKYYDIQVSFA